MLKNKISTISIITINIQMSYKKFPILLKKIFKILDTYYFFCNEIRGIIPYVVYYVIHL